MKIPGDKFNLFWVGDVHVGNANFAEKPLRATVEHILSKNKTCPSVVLLGGDLIDCINFSDPRFSPAEIDPEYSIRDLKDLPRKQADYVYSILQPMEHLIRGYIIGNHEEKYIKHNHFDVYDYLSLKLNRCEKLGFSAMIDINGVKLAVTHGASGATTTEGAITQCKKIFQDFRADINIMGHVHKLATSFKTHLEYDGKRMYPVDSWYCLGGSYLYTYRRGYRNYFEGKPASLSDIGFIECRIDLEKEKCINAVCKRFKRI